MKLYLPILGVIAVLLVAGCANTDSAAAKDSPEHNTTFTQKAGNVADTANSQQADSNTATDDSTPVNSRGAEDQASTDRRAAARRSIGLGH